MVHKLLQMYMQSKDLTLLLLSRRKPGAAISTFRSEGCMQPTQICAEIRSEPPSLQKVKQMHLRLPPIIHIPNVPGNFCFSLKKIHILNFEYAPQPHICHDILVDFFFPISPVKCIWKICQHHQYVISLVWNGSFPSLPLLKGKVKRASLV